MFPGVVSEPLDESFTAACLAGRDPRADSTHERVVKKEDGERLAKEFGVPFMETSARSGLNVELAFTALAKALRHRSSSEADDKFKLHDYVSKEVKSPGCCRS
ncbi:unnamed protein product [Arctogadus glacialis]